MEDLRYAFDMETMVAGVCMIRFLGGVIAGNSWLVDDSVVFCFG